MANYDKPAFTWTVISKTLDIAAQRDDLEVPAGTITQYPYLRNAMANIGQDAALDDGTGYGYGVPSSS